MHAPSTQPLPYEYNFSNPQLHYNEIAGFTDINGLSEYSYGSYDGNSSPKEIFSNKRELPTRSSNMPKPAQPLKDSEQCIEDNNIEASLLPPEGSHLNGRVDSQDKIQCVNSRSLRSQAWRFRLRRRGRRGTVDSDQECDVLCDENCEDEECPSCDESQVCCNPEFCSSGDCDDQVAWTTLNRSVSHIILL